MIDKLRLFFNKTWEKFRKDPFYFFLSIVGFNLLYKFYHISFGSIDLDESWHTFYAQMPLGELLKTSSGDPNPPLYNILVGLWIEIFGLSEAGVRSFSVILSSLTAGILFLFAWRNISLKVAVIGCLIFTFSDVQYFFAHNARVYMLVGFLIICSYYFFFEFLKTKQWKILAAYTITNVLLLYTHTTPIYAIASQALISLFFYGLKDIKSIVIIGCSQVVSILTFVPWILKSSYYNKQKPTSWVSPPTFSDAKQLFIDYLNNEYLAVLVLFIALSFSALLIVKKKQLIYDHFIFFVLLTWTFFPIISNFAISHLVVPIFLKRYMLYSTQGLYLLIAYMMCNLPVKKISQFVIAVCVVISFAVTVDQDTFMGEEWRDSVGLVKKSRSSNSLILVAPFFEYTSFAYYYNKAFYKDWRKTLDHLSDENIFMADDPEVFSRVDINRYEDIIVLTSQFGVNNANNMLNYLRKKRLLIDSTMNYGVNYYRFIGSDLIDSIRINYDNNSLPDKSRIKTIENAPSGKNISFANKNSLYSEGVQEKISALKQMPKYVVVQCNYWLKNENSQGSLVFSMSNFENTYVYASIELSKKDGWNVVDLRVPLSQIKDKSDIFKAYVLSTGNGEIWVDDLQIIFKK